MKDRIFVIDGSSYLYRAYHAMPPLSTSKGQPTGAVKGVTNMLMNLKKDSEGSPIIVVFDAKGKTFRNDIYSEYKANRERQPEDIQVAIPIIKKFLNNLNIQIVEKDGFEADDVIGTLSYEISKEKNTKVFMMTPDKDFAQLVKENVFLYKPAFMGRE